MWHSSEWMNAFNINSPQQPGDTMAKKPLPKKDMNHLYQKMAQVNRSILLIWVTIIGLFLYVEYGWMIPTF